MRKILTSSMIAGAALLVAACGGEAETNNAAVTDLGNDTTMDMNATDMGMDMNMGDANMTNGLEPALENAAEATENAAEAIENAQEATQ